MICRTRETIVVMLQAFDRRKDLTEVKTGYRGRELGGVIEMGGVRKGASAVNTPSF